MGRCGNARASRGVTPASRFLARHCFQAILGVFLLAAFATGSRADVSDLLSPGWGANFITCAGEKKPVRLRAASPESGIMANGVISCRDEGDAFVYAVEYMNSRWRPRRNGSPRIWSGSAAAPNARARTVATTGSTMTSGPSGSRSTLAGALPLPTSVPGFQGGPWSGARLRVLCRRRRHLLADNPDITR